MRIVHIAPNAPYNEGWGYQENLLPKYQHNLGHEVTLVITNLMHQNGKLVETDCCDKMMPDGVRLIRKPSGYSTHHGLIESIRNDMDVYSLLCELKPDYVFFHGLSSSAIRHVVLYKCKNNTKCVIVQDNHVDEANAYRPSWWKRLLLRTFYRQLVRSTISYVDKVYGVTPWRQEYAEGFYGVPHNKTDILIMGADDDSMDLANRLTYRNKIRSQFGISNEEFLIVSGGKLDEYKNIDVLMEACGRIDKVRLIIFGSVEEKIKERFHQLLSRFGNITYIGWIKASDCYKYFYAADLVCFPGSHSVLWEQACASKVPCMFKRWHGMNHVDNGGNSVFVDSDNMLVLQKEIQEMLFTPKYYSILDVARSEKTDIYRYSFIAQKSIDDLFTV